MRSSAVLLCCLAVLLGSSVAAARRSLVTKESKVSADGKVITKRWVFKKGAEANDGSSSRADVAITNVLVTLTNWCQNPMTLIDNQTSVGNGYWVALPGAAVPSAQSFSPVIAMRVRHQDFSPLINLTAAWNGVQIDGVTPWPTPLTLGLLEVPTFTEVVVGYWAGLALGFDAIGEYVVGDTGVFNIAIGHQNWRLPLPMTVPC